MQRPVSGMKRIKQEREREGRLGGGNIRQIVEGDLSGGAG